MKLSQAVFLVSVQGSKREKLPDGGRSDGDSLSSLCETARENTANSNPIENGSWACDSNLKCSATCDAGKTGNWKKATFSIKCKDPPKIKEMIKTSNGALKCEAEADDGCAALVASTEIEEGFLTEIGNSRKGREYSVTCDNGSTLSSSVFCKKGKLKSNIDYRTGCTKFMCDAADAGAEFPIGPGTWQCKEKKGKLKCDSAICDWKGILEDGVYTGSSTEPDFRVHCDPDNGWAWKGRFRYSACEEPTFVCNASEAYENFPIGYGVWECDENIMEGEGDGNGLQDGFNCSPSCDWSGSSPVRFNIQCRKRTGWSMIENSNIGPIGGYWDFGYWDDTCHLEEHGNTEMIVYNSLSSPEAFLLTGTGTKTHATFEVPSDNYADESRYAVVKDQLFIFGGGNPGRKIAKLEGCSFVELPVELNFAVDDLGAALSINNGEQALVCFDGRPSWIGTKCDVFDGNTATPTFSTEYCHTGGGLALYKGKPTTVGCAQMYQWSQYRKTETLTETGWERLPDHPTDSQDHARYHNLVGLPSGSMLLIGARNSAIWRLRDDEWSLAGRLKRGDSQPGVALFGNSIYVIPGNFHNAIQRVDLDDDEEVTNVAIIATISGPDHPMIIPLSYKSCVEN